MVAKPDAAGELLDSQSLDEAGTCFVRGVGKQAVGAGSIGGDRLFVGDDSFAG